MNYVEIKDIDSLIVGKRYMGVNCSDSWMGNKAFDLGIFQGLVVRPWSNLLRFRTNDGCNYSYSLSDFTLSYRMYLINGRLNLYKLNI